jgi:photosystem I subunit V
MVCTASTMSSPVLQQRSAFAPRVQIKSRMLRASTRSPRQVTRALSDTNLIISGATAVSLALGRFVFLDFQRDNANRQGLPVQNGVPYAEAGDKLSEEASFLKGTNDPAGPVPSLLQKVFCCRSILEPEHPVMCRLQPDRRLCVGCHWTRSWIRRIGNHQSEHHWHQPCPQVLSKIPTCTILSIQASHCCTSNTEVLSHQQ